MPSLPSAISPLFALLGLMVCVVVGLVAIAVLAMRGLRFRPPAVAVGDATGLPEPERGMMEAGHRALETLGFRYVFCLARRAAAVPQAESLECYYTHSGFDAVAVLSAGQAGPCVVFRSYRADGWSLETHAVPVRESLPRPLNTEAWVTAKTATLAEQWQAHLARFRVRAAGASAVLPEPSQLFEHERRLAAEELARHVASGLLAPVSPTSAQHRLTWASVLRRVTRSGPRAQLLAMQAAGVRFGRVALAGGLLGLGLGAAGIFYAARSATTQLRVAQAEAQAAGVATSLEQISEVMSITERRTLEQGAMWWVAAMQGSAASGDEARLAALRAVPDEQKKRGSEPPPNVPLDSPHTVVVEAMEAAYALLAEDLKRQQEAKVDGLFHRDVIALATLLRDTHWSLGGAVQAARVKRYLALLTALEEYGLGAAAPGGAFTGPLLTAMPVASELQRDAVAAYFLDQLAAPRADVAPPLARFLRDWTPLGPVSLAGHLRCEVALWQALQSKREWSDPALLPSAEQESNLIAQLHQQPSMTQRQAQFEILVAYAPRRALCTGAMAAQLLMQQLPTPALYLEPVTMALGKLSASGPGIEIVPEGENAVLQMTLATVPPRLVQWRLRGPSATP